MRRSHPRAAGLGRVCSRLFFPFRTALAIGTILSPLAGARPQSALGTFYEDRNGSTQDIAGQADCTSDAANKRIWIAQGRVRASIRASDRVRMLAEDKTFNASASSHNFERLIAVEVDDVNQRLYTLTEDALYRESIAPPFSPAAPGDLAVFDLRVPTSPCSESLVVCERLQDLELYDDSNLPGHPDMAFVLTTKRILCVIDNGGSGFGALCKTGYTTEMLSFSPDEGECLASNLPDPHPCGLPTLLSFDVDQLERLRVYPDANGRLTAYVLARMRAFNSLAGSRPIPNQVIACDLGTLGTTYSAPRFDLDPGIRIHYARWNPVPSVPPEPPPGTLFSDWTVYQCDVFALGVKRYAYLACGKRNMVKRIDVTNAFPQICPLTPWLPDQTFDIEPSLPTAQQHHVKNVLCDAALPAPQRFFAINEFGAFHAFDPQVGTNFETQSENFAGASPRDMARIELPISVRSVWATLDGEAGHNNKVMDVRPSLTTVPLVGEFVNLSTNDGGVMIDDAFVGGDIFLPTFGGVVRFQRLFSPLRWEMVPASFTSSEIPANSGEVNITEHIAAGRLPGGGLNLNRVYTCSAKGEFVEFRIDNTTKAMEDPVEFGPNYFDLNPVICSGWTPVESVHLGLDVLAGDLGAGDQQNFVFTNASWWPADLISGCPQLDRTQHGLIVYARNAAGTGWQYLGVTKSTIQINPGTGGALLNTALAFIKVPASGVNPDRFFMFFGHSQGFLSVDLNPMLATPQALPVVKSEVYFSPSAPYDYLPTWSMVASKDRLFVLVNNPVAPFDADCTGPPPWSITAGNHVRIYRWDPQTGTVHEQVGSVSHCQIKNALPGQENHGRGWRAHFNEKNAATGEGYVYFGCEPYLLQFWWSGQNTPGQNDLTLTGHWRSDYELEFQDCHVYQDVDNLGNDNDGILGIKNAESFGVIKETP